MRVLLSTHGSRGKIEPVVGLAVRLRHPARRCWLDGDQQRAWLAYIRVQLRLAYEMNRELPADSGQRPGDESCAALTGCLAPAMAAGANSSRWALAV